MFHFSPKIVTDGLILCLDPANPNWGVGQKINDLTPNYYDGTLVSATWSNSNFGSIDMDGSPSKITLQPLPLLGVSKFSIQLWAKLGANQNMAFFSLGTSISNDILFAYQLTLGGVLFAQVNNGGDGTGYFSYVPDNTWSNFTMVYNGNGSGNAERLKIYFNGVEQSLTFNGAAVPATTTGSSSGYEVGNYLVSSGWNFKGKISSFLIYDRDLSSQEVKNNYLALRGRFK